MNNFHIDNTTYAPYCSKCRDNGFDFSRDFVDMCEACQDVNILKGFRKERDNSVQNYMLDNA